MSAEQNKALFRRLVEMFNEGRGLEVFEYMAPDCEIVDERGVAFNKQSYLERIGEVGQAFPDYHLEIQDLMAIEDKVVARYTETGTMKGAFMGVPPTGKTFSAPAIEIWRFKNNKVTGLWMARDTLTTMIQTGMMPEPGAETTAA